MRSTDSLPRCAECALDSGGQTGTRGPLPVSPGAESLRSSGELSRRVGMRPRSVSLPKQLPTLLGAFRSCTGCHCSARCCSLGRFGAPSASTRSLLEAEKDLDACLPATGARIASLRCSTFPSTARCREAFVDMTNWWPAAAYYERWPLDLSLPPPCTPAAPALTQCRFAHPSCQVVGRP